MAASLQESPAALEATGEDFQPDLPAYFARIGHSGPAAPGLDLLADLQRRHLASIPFEAVDVLLGRGVSLDPAAVEDKLVRRRRGGYCFEQNGLFRRVLRRLGFDVEPRIARVLWGARDAAAALPRTHMCLLVRLEGVPWLVDVGFGSTVPPRPLRWDSEEPQETPFGRYRFAPTPFGRRLEVDTGSGWLPAYEVSLEPPLDIDLEQANWYTSTHPNSTFRRNLIAARTLPDVRYALLGPEFTTRPAGREPERRRLDADELETVLRDIFSLPVEPGWKPLLERVAAGAE
jgi:N-hydroxyarylamine O-acetyltransferase